MNKYLKKRKTVKIKTNRNTTLSVRIKKFLLGNHEKYGALKLTVIYFLLTLFGIAFLYPLFNMLTYALKDSSDLINPLVMNLPSKFYMGNFEKASQLLEYGSALGQTLLVAIVPAVVQVISGAVIAYGFARFRFPCKKLLLALVLVTFIIPPQVTMIPQFVFFTDMKLTGSILTYILPAVFGQGLKSAVIILVFYMFFSTIPKSLEEAAKIDGANSFKIFIKIALPLVIPAFIISFLLSFVWYYNETTLATLYFGDTFSTLLMNLGKMQSGAEEMQTALNEAVYMAGTFLCILPMLILYAIMQHFFIESVDNAGITGE